MYMMPSKRVRNVRCFAESGVEFLKYRLCIDKVVSSQLWVYRKMGRYLFYINQNTVTMVHQFRTDTTVSDKKSARLGGGHHNCLLL